MQTGINGYEIYKNVGVMHAAVFLLTGPKRLNMHNSWAIIEIFEGSISEQIAIGTAIRAIRANNITKHSFF